MQNVRALLLAASLIVLTTSTPGVAQNQNEQRMYESMFDVALDKLNIEREAIAGLQTQLLQETDLTRGCATLDQTLTHLRQADALLTDMRTYADRLRRRAQIDGVDVQQAGIREEIGLKEGDIARMCQNLPE